MTARWKDFFREHHQDELRKLVDDYPSTRSITIDIIDLHNHDADLAQHLFTEPDAVLRNAERTLSSIHETLSRVNARITNHPGLLQCRDVEARHIGEIVTLEGTVTNTAIPEATLSTGVFSCHQCNQTTTVHPTGIELKEPEICPACENPTNPVLLNDESEFINLQQLTIKNRDNTETETERPMRVFVTDDLVDTVSSDDYLRVTGIIRVNQQSDTNRFNLYLDARGIQEEPAGQSEEAKALEEVIHSRWQSMINR